MSQKNQFKLALVLAACILNSGCGGWLYMGQHPSVAYRKDVDHMPEEARRQIESIRLAVDPTKPILVVGGDYGAPTTTTGDGV